MILMGFNGIYHLFNGRSTVDGGNPAPGRVTIGNYKTL